MTISKVNSLGWAVGDKLTAAQANAIDTRWASCVDGTSGGVWTPSAQVDLQGTGGGAGSALNLGNYPTLTSQDVVRWLRLDVQASTNLTNAIASGNFRPHWYQSSVATQSQCYIEVVGPDHATLKSVQFYMHGNINGTGSHTGGPAGMPIFRVLEHQIGVSTTMAEAQTYTMSWATDFASTPANYDTFWSKTLNNGGAGFRSLAQNTSTPWRHTVHWQGESGANSLVGLTLMGIKCTFTVTRLGPG